MKVPGVKKIPTKWHWIFFPANRGFQGISLAVKVNSPSNPQWGRGSNGRCIVISSGHPKLQKSHKGLEIANLLRKFYSLVSPVSHQAVLHAFNPPWKRFLYGERSIIRRRSYLIILISVSSFCFAVAKRSYRPPPHSPQPRSRNKLSVCCNPPLPGHPITHRKCL